MSIKTKEAMEAAIEAHLADEMDGAILTGYWLVMCGADMEKPGTTSYFHLGPDTQPFHVSLGLNSMTTKFLDKDYRDSMKDDD
jgi:hypothetical protein